jgi:S-adenosylmethionine/arginine decarboxylase-like enzyme
MKAQMYNYNCWVEETDPTILVKTYTKKLELAGFGIESLIEKHFAPQGYTCLFLLSESHFAIHTFPEEGQSYIELSSCVKNPFIRFVKSV